MTRIEDVLRKKYMEQPKGNPKKWVLKTPKKEKAVRLIDDLIFRLNKDKRRLYLMPRDIGYGNIGVLERMIMLEESFAKAIA